MKQPITQHIVFEHMAGRTTPLQRQALFHWLRTEENQQQYYTWLADWERLNLQYLPEEEDALQKLLRRVDELPASSTSTPTNETPVLPLPALPAARWRGWLVAAAILLVLLGAWNSRYDWLHQTLSTGYGEVTAFTLPDGSLVTLNANSSLRVPRLGFGTRLVGRDVQLKGEATFSVVHTADHQRFVVHTPEGLDVVVLGTEFTVKARSQHTKVVLIKGKVLVNYPTATHKTAQRVLKPGDMVTLSRNGQLQQTNTPRPHDFTAWDKQQFIFDRTSLGEVAKLLADTYGLQVHFATDELARQTISGSFHAQTADELLQAISDVMAINVVRHNQQVTLIDNHSDQLP